MQIKRSLRRLVNFFRSKYLIIKYKLPKNTILEGKCNLFGSKFEGGNKIGNNAICVRTKVGYGTLIAKDSYIVDAKIGKYCQIGYTSQIGAHPLHRVVSICPAFYSTRKQMGYTYVDKTCFEEFKYSENDNETRITIGNDVWITPSNVKIVQGVSIGDGAIVLADAVVTKDVPPYAIVGGVPAQIRDYRFNPEQIDFLLNLKWWDKDIEWIKTHAKYFCDIELLINIIMEENNGC